MSSDTHLSEVNEACLIAVNGRGLLSSQKIHMVPQERQPETGAFPAFDTKLGIPS